MSRARRVALAVATALGSALNAASGVAAQEGPPEPMEARRIEFPSVQERTLGNGLSVVVLESPAHPYVRLSMVLRSGTASDPDGKPGVASLTAGLLSRGTQGRSEGEIAEAIGFVGGSLSARASRDWTTVSVSSLAESLPVSLAVLGDVVREPAFDEAVIESSRALFAQSAQFEASNLLQVAQGQLTRELFRGHAYGSGPASPGAFARITADDVRQFHDEHYVASNAILVVTGSVRADDVFARVEATFGSWGRGAPSRPSYRPPVERRGRTVTLVHRPGSPQSYVMVGQLLPSADDPAWADVEVALRALYLTRLFPILRERRGWSYQTFASVNPTADLGFWRAGAVVPAEVTDSTVREIVVQLENLRSDLLPLDDLARGKGSLVGGFPLSIDTPGEVVDQLVSSRLRGLGDDHLYSYRERIGRVTPESLLEVAGRMIRPDVAAIVVVGDATRVYDDLRSFGEVRVVTPEGIEIDVAELGLEAGQR